jgi:hypothetical protein
MRDKVLSQGVLKVENESGPQPSRCRQIKSHRTTALSYQSMTNVAGKFICSLDRYGPLISGPREDGGGDQGAQEPARQAGATQARAQARKLLFSAPLSLSSQSFNATRCRSRGLHDPGQATGT